MYIVTKQQEDGAQNCYEFKILCKLLTFTCAVLSETGNSSSWLQEPSLFTYNWVIISTRTMHSENGLNFWRKNNIQASE